jgi:hypothetical protein
VKRLFRAALLFIVACSKVDDSKQEAVVGPDRTQFIPVSTWIEHRCGSLDCHGSRYRNFRIWGTDGMRLAIGDVPGGAPTTSDERESTYQSLVVLEPALMRDVLSDKGVRPERLTLVRKARGLEKHEGGTIMNEGDPRDRCVTTWLAGATDSVACSTALTLP